MNAFKLSSIFIAIAIVALAVSGFVNPSPLFPLVFNLGKWLLFAVLLTRAIVLGRRACFSIGFSVWFVCQSVAERFKLDFAVDELIHELYPLPNASAAYTRYFLQQRLMSEIVAILLACLVGWLTMFLMARRQTEC